MLKVINKYSHLDIELTERCNHNCIYCYINRGADDPKQQEELTTSEFKAIIDEAVALGFLKLRFTGGEPLLREDFEELYIHARKSGMIVKILTNGSLISPRIVNLFKKIPPLDKIQITVSSMEENTFEEISRVPGSFNSVRQGLDRLRQKNIAFNIRGVMLPQTRHEQETFKRWAIKYQGSDVPLSFIYKFDLRARRDSEAKNDMIRRLRIPAVEWREITKQKGPEYKHIIKAFLLKYGALHGKKLFTCGGGVFSACVDAYGKIQPCLLLRHPDTVINWKEKSLREGFDKFFQELRKKTATQSNYLNRCGKCFLKTLCDQCPAKSWLEHETLDTPVEYWCQITHEIGRFLDLLKPGEKSWEVKDGLNRINN